MSFFSTEAVEAFGQSPEVCCSTLLHAVLREHLRLFPPSIELARATTVLDVAARSGEWVRDVARTYPGSVVLGLEQRQMWVDYARVLAHQARVGNVGFLESPLTDLLAQSHFFAVVRACCVWLEVSLGAWPVVLHEWARVCAYGGHILWVESNLPITNSTACGQVFEQKLVASVWSLASFPGMPSSASSASL